MTDTEILDHIVEWLKPYVLNLDPIGPAGVKYGLKFIERTRQERRKAEVSTNGTSFSDETVSELYKTPGPYADVDPVKYEDHAVYLHPAPWH